MKQNDPNSMTTSKIDQFVSKAMAKPAHLKAEAPRSTLWSWLGASRRSIGRVMGYGLIALHASAGIVNAQATCTPAERISASSAYFEDFETGSARRSDPNVLNHTYAGTGIIPDGSYAVGRSLSLSGAWAQTENNGHGDADGNSDGRYLFINMRGSGQPGNVWTGEFYRQNGVSLVSALPPGATLAGFRFRTSLAGTCFGCSQAPIFTLRLENNANGAVIASATSTGLGVVNDEIWRTASVDLIPAPVGVTALNLVLFNSQPNGVDGNDVGIDNIDFAPLYCNAPTLDFTKAATLITSTVGQSDVAEVGDIVRYTYTIQNNGTSTSYNVALTETTFTGTGTPPVPTVLSGGADLDGGNGTATDVAPGATLVFTADYVLTAADIAAGFIDNQARADYADLVATPFNTLSDGDPGTAGPQVTRVPIPILARIETTKTATASIAAGAFANRTDAGDTVSYTLTVQNAGNTALTSVGIASDTLTRVGGAPLSLTTGPTFVSNSGGSPAGTLQPGETATYTATYVITVDDLNAGGVSNTATGTGTPPTGPAITDVSDNGIDTDGNTVNDPTVTPLAPTPIDAVDDAPAAVNGFTGGDTPSVLDNDLLNGVAANPADITLTSTGTASDGVTALGLATAPTSGSITMNPDGTITVAAGTTAGTYSYTYEICENLNPTNCDTAIATVVVDPALIDAVDDTGTVASGATGGTAVPNVLVNDTLNGAPATLSNVTLSQVSTTNPNVTLDPATGAVSVAPGTAAGTYTVTYEICEQLNPTNCDTAVATITVGAAVIDAVDDAPAAVDGLVGGDTPSVLDNDLLNGVAVNPAEITLTSTGTASDGVTTLGLATAPASGSITMNPDGTITVAAGTTAGTYSYTYEICENLNPTNCDTAVATVVVGLPADTALVDDVSAGNQPGTAVTVAVFPNDSDPNSIFDRSTLQIVGTAGPGESLVVPGEGVWTVDLVAGTVTFTPEEGFFGDPTPIQYQVRDTLGNLLAPAFIVVTYLNTPAFVCSDVIGKVYEDHNHDGYQDEGEKGISGARLATVNGRIIATDEHGRFSVPCADLPQDIGSTFLLKLDPRSLPTGFRVVTENPLTVRLTPGTMRKMNFGVSPSSLVRVDLTAEAFDAKTSEPTEALAKGLKAVVKAAAKQPSFVRLTYFADGEAPEVIKDRLKLVEARLQEHWRERGKGKLWLEVTVVEKN